jgi:hypothetical protein
MQKEFNYVIGYPWREDQPDKLATYMMYCSEIQYGNIEEATEMLEYVRSQGDEDSEMFAIYRISYEKVK